MIYARRSTHARYSLLPIGWLGLGQKALHHRRREAHALRRKVHRQAKGRQVLQQSAVLHLHAHLSQDAQRVAVDALGFGLR